MATDKTATRRRYSAEFKAQVLGECDAPGASVAKVAMSHGINANVVHGWRQLAREARQAVAAPPNPGVHAQTQFLPAMMASTATQAVAAAMTTHIEVEIRRGAVTH